ncbi:hypothetical protein N9195_03140 [bacterium]|nr:hypothetical protein [bacterium]
MIKDTLLASELWGQFDTDVFECSKVVADESFYPLYRWKNYISYSMVELLRLKGSVTNNPHFDRFAHLNPSYPHLAPGVNIDSEIVRVGAPLCGRNKVVRTKDEFIHSAAVAFSSDLRTLEKRHEDSHFYVYVGGKDSLNILLHNWNKKITAISGEPNYALVKEFCEHNELNIPVIRLAGEESDTPDMLTKEIIANCCRIDLAHVRWSNAVKRIISSNKTSSNSVLLTGAMADVMLTPNYEHYRPFNFNKQRPTVTERLISRINRNVIGRTMSDPTLFETCWTRGAHWQGVVHGIIRESIGVPNYSAYHGKDFLDLIAETQLSDVATEDLRQKIGNAICGKQILYPESNPSPEKWTSRDNQSNFETWKVAFSMRG